MIADLQRPGHQAKEVLDSHGQERQVVRLELGQVDHCVDLQQRADHIQAVQHATLWVGDLGASCVIVERGSAGLGGSLHPGPPVGGL